MAHAICANIVEVDPVQRGVVDLHAPVARLAGSGLDLQAQPDGAVDIAETQVAAPGAAVEAFGTGDQRLQLQLAGRVGEVVELAEQVLRRAVIVQHQGGPRRQGQQAQQDEQQQYRQ